MTKGDQYDVREKDGEGRAVRNLGKPVELAVRYSEEGADEIAFLNITSFRGEPVNDAPMLKVLELASATVRVPLCIGGGIRSHFILRRVGSLIFFGIAEITPTPAES